eukprot:7872173-Alexandrium_andersonii.AAC.1
MAYGGCAQSGGCGDGCCENNASREFCRGRRREIAMAESPLRGEGASDKTTHAWGIRSDKKYPSFLRNSRQNQT